MAHISRSVLAENAQAAWRSGVRLFDPSVLEADALGHGARLVHGILQETGFAPAGGARTGGDAAEAARSQSATKPTLSPAQLYGLPGSGRRPALRLTGSVLSTKDLRAGEGVSYGYAYRAPSDTRVALVTGGYAQGIVRALGGEVDVAIAGERHPIVGRVAMDVCVVEIRDAAVHRGDQVVFLGDPAVPEPSLHEWMQVSGLSAAELVTPVGLRAIREVIS